jgi:hypothetical protein
LERPLPPSRDDLLALLRKYETIAKLRRDRARSGAMAERSVLRALAREFPGALRELDTVTLVEIDKRRRTLAEAAGGGPVETWMAWMVAYHVTMRAALLVKARVATTLRSPLPGTTFEQRLRRGKARAPSDELLRRAKADAARLSPIPLDDAFVRAVARPPDGRLNAAVFERLGRQFGVSPDEIWQALFPARRERRY